MGLDNIPKHYPCKKGGTAVTTPLIDMATGNPHLDDNGKPITQIDCTATKEAGGCPWSQAYEASGLTGGIVTGIFGTSCWYRGKWGNSLLTAIDASDAHSFYGDNEEQTEKSPESCREVAAVLSAALMQSKGEPIEWHGEDVSKDIRYAAWWLEWVASEADGSVCWY